MAFNAAAPSARTGSAVPVFSSISVPQGPGESEANARCTVAFAAIVNVSCPPHRTHAWAELSSKPFGLPGYSLGVKWFSAIPFGHPTACSFHADLLSIPWQVAPAVGVRVKLSCVHFAPSLVGGATCRTCEASGAALEPPEVLLPIVRSATVNSTGSLTRANTAPTYTLPASRWSPSLPRPRFATPTAMPSPPPSWVTRIVGCPFEDQRVSPSNDTDPLDEELVVDQ